MRDVRKLKVDHVIEPFRVCELRATSIFLDPDLCGEMPRSVVLSMSLVDVVIAELVLLISGIMMA